MEPGLDEEADPVCPGGGSGDEDGGDDDAHPDPEAEELEEILFGDAGDDGGLAGGGMGAAAAGGVPPADPAGDIVPLPPPDKTPHDVEVIVGGGAIRLWKATRHFQAVCRRGTHKVDGKFCALNRYGMVYAKLQHKGRPLGLLRAWLLKCGGCTNREDHICSLSLHALSQATRTETRDELEKIPGSDVLFEFERPLTVGVPVESIRTP